MARNLDIAALRALVTVADCGGVTRAAGQLHLTQSAVSMQIKRLEESLGQPLLDRVGRGVRLTDFGDRLLSYARRIIALNDEALGRLADSEVEGEIVLGVPHDIIYPAIRGVLRAMAAEFPRVRVHLASDHSRILKDKFARGRCDLILTTEVGTDPGGIVLDTRALRWVGAPDGEAWLRRPVPLAFSRSCMFRQAAIATLDQAGIEWTLSVETDSDRTVEAAANADLGILALLEGSLAPHLALIPEDCGLPELPEHRINLYGHEIGGGPARERLVELLREAYARPLPSTERVAGTLAAEPVGA